MKKPVYMIWDIDGVWYSYHRLPNREFYSLCDEANAEAAMEIIPHLLPELARQLATESFERFHDCYGAFMPLADQSRFTRDEFRNRIFKHYHANLYVKLMERHPDFFADTQETVELVHRTSGYVRHGALSHSWMEGWGTRILDNIGVLPFFDPNALLGLDQYGFIRKFESVEPLKIIMARMGADPQRTYFVEDSLRNLECASQIQGLRGIYIHHGSPLDSLPSFVAGQFATPADLMHHIKLSSQVLGYHQTRLTTS